MVSPHSCHSPSRDGALVVRCTGAVDVDSKGLDDVVEGDGAVEDEDTNVVDRSSLVVGAVI